MTIRPLFINISINLKYLENLFTRQGGIPEKTTLADDHRTEKFAARCPRSSCNRNWCVLAAQVIDVSLNNVAKHSTKYFALSSSNTFICVVLNFEKAVVRHSLSHRYVVQVFIFHLSVSLMRKQIGNNRVCLFYLRSRKNMCQNVYLVPEIGAKCVYTNIIYIKIYFTYLICQNVRFTWYWIMLVLMTLKKPFFFIEGMCLICILYMREDNTWILLTG